MASPGEATVKDSHVGKKKKVTTDKEVVRGRHCNRVKRFI